MALESTQPLAEMVGKGGRGVGMKTMPPSCGDCHEILGISTSWILKGLLQGLLYLSQTLFNLRGRQRCYWKNPPPPLSLCVTYTQIHFFLNNQQDALIIPILFCYKTLHVSGNILAHQQEFSTVHSALVSFIQVFDDRFQWTEHPDSVWKRSSKICMKLTSAECTVENSWWWAKRLPETCRIF
jgi:hypothetical protein